MSSETKSCYLISQSRPKLPNVFLPDQKEIFVGRQIETKVDDIKCSRQQLCLTANYEEKYVKIEQVGARPSGFNGCKTLKNQPHIAENGDYLELLYGKYPYVIEFNPPPPLFAKKEKKASKRSMSEELEEKDFDSSEKKANLMKKVKENDAIASTSATKNESNSDCGTWEEIENKSLYLYTPPGCMAKPKIASFDMDKTLIKTISGNEFPKDCNDWQLLYPDVPGKLKKLHQDDYKVVIFSNQNGLSYGKTKVDDFKNKIERIVKKIGVPVQCFFAVGLNNYRKPRIGMWNYLIQKKNGSLKIDMENSFFVGDAAGRPASASRKKKDHSSADRSFASNVGLNFFTPEEFFLGQKKETYNPPEFNPKELTTKASQTNQVYEKDEKEIVVMVGLPGSGKSHFSKNNLSSYVCVNRDSLKTWQKCVTKTEEALKQGKSVVIDNTNTDKTSRQRYIDIAKKYNVPVRCFWLDYKLQHAKHNNMFRMLTDKSHVPISDMILHSHAKNFVPPQKEEGFSEIVKIDFVPNFKSDEEKSLYEMYLLE